MPTTTFELDGVSERTRQEMLAVLRKRIGQILDPKVAKNVKVIHGVGVVDGNRVGKHRLIIEYDNA